MSEINIERKEIYDPSLEEFVNEELPTVTVRDATRVFSGGHVRGTPLLTRDLGGGTFMRLTTLRIGASRSAEFYLHDSRKGTFDWIYLESAGQELDLGAPTAPIHVTKGTFTIGAFYEGTATAGTYYTAYEGLIPSSGTEVVE